MKRAWLAAKVEAMPSFGQTIFFDGINQEGEGESYVNSKKTIWLKDSATARLRINRCVCVWKRMKERIKFRDIREEEEEEEEEERVEWTKNGNWLAIYESNKWVLKRGGTEESWCNRLSKKLLSSELPKSLQLKLNKVK